MIQVRVTCKKECLVFAFSSVLLQEIFWINHDAKSLRGPSPLWSPYLPASNLPLPSTYISTHLDVPVYLSVGGPAGTKTNSLPPTLADPGHTCLSDFRNRLKLTACFALFVLSMKEVEKNRGWAHGRRRSFSEKSPLVGPQDHLTCGFYSWPHNVCVGGGYYLFADSASPYSLTPQRHYSGQI